MGSAAGQQFSPGQLPVIDSIFVAADMPYIYQMLYEKVDERKASYDQYYPKHEIDNCISYLQWFMTTLRRTNKPLIRDSKPTGYARTAASEQRSVKIFWGLMDDRQIMGKPEVSDKNPNHDGILEFTLADGTPVGNFAVQVKTLQKRHRQDPKYQCKLGFLAYCLKINLPVILVAVDQELSAVHWRHIDTATINEAQANMTGKTVTIRFPFRNIITSSRQEYVAAWQKIVEQDALLRRNADEHQRAYERIEADYAALRHRLAPPDMLNKAEITSFQRYLDHINRILDHEFPALKARAYPEYWKMSLAVTNITLGERSHFLIPVAYGNSELPVRQLEITSEEDMMAVFHQQGAVVLAGGNAESILHIGEHQAYNVVKSDLLRAFNKAPLFVADINLANEYLAGFVACFYAILGLEHQRESMPLKELQYLLTAVLPVYHEISHSFIADGITELAYGIDGEKDRAPRYFYKERINEAKALLKGGYMPRYRTHLYSKLFYVPLVHQFINLLLDAGQTHLIPVYITDPLQKNHTPLHIGIRNLPLVQKNIKLFFARFQDIYERYIAENFANVKEEVDFFEGASLLVFVLQTAGRAAEKPYMELYRIHDDRFGKRRILFYTDTDADNPMDRRRWLIDRDPTCVIYGQTFVITSLTVVVLDFLFERSPSYAFIHKQVLRKLEPYLDKKARGPQRPLENSFPQQSAEPMVPQSESDAVTE